MTSTATVDQCWHGRWLGPSTIALDGGTFRLAQDGDPAPERHLSGTVLPGFRDAHVHLGLVDPHALVTGGITAVDDLGWDLATAAAWVGAPNFPDVRIAGQLLTVDGGYPSASGWAPQGAVRVVSSAADAVAAVGEQVAAGASLVKITLNSDAGPVLDDVRLGAIVAAARAHAVPVVAHAQGVGQAERAWRAGVDWLAHTPWSESLSNPVVSAMAGSQTWISTLDIHGWGDYGREFSVAQDNLRRFHAAGGAVLYGTDVGNGPLSVGINRRELQALNDAGVAGDALVAAVAAPVFGRRVSWSPRDLATATGNALVHALASTSALDAFEPLLTPHHTGHNPA